MPRFLLAFAFAHYAYNFITSCIIVVHQIIRLCEPHMTEKTAGLLSSRRRVYTLRPSTEPYVRRYRIRLLAKLNSIFYLVNIHFNLWHFDRVMPKHHIKLLIIHALSLTSAIEPFIQEFKDVIEKPVQCL